MSAGNAWILPWLTHTERVTSEEAESLCHIRRLRHKPMGGANRLRQACEYRQCGDLAMPESHVIGGGELMPHPETAAQTCD